MFELSPNGERLSGAELATKISFLLRNTTPNDELLNAAAAGALDTDDGVAQVVTQMLEEADASSAVSNFHRELFGLDRYSSILKNTTTFPAYTEALNDVFYALADPTRRAIVGALGRGPASVSALAAPFEMALPSFMKHLSVLERSGVIRSSKVGRVRTCELRPKALSRAERWIASQRAVWESRSDRMAAFVERLHQEDLARGNR